MDTITRKPLAVFLAISIACAAALAVLASSLLHSISIRARAGKSRAELTDSKVNRSVG